MLRRRDDKVALIQASTHSSTSQHTFVLTDHVICLVVFFAARCRPEWIFIVQSAVPSQFLPITSTLAAVRICLWYGLPSILGLPTCLPRIPPRRPPILISSPVAAEAYPHPHYRKITYKQLYTLTSRVVNALEREGIKPGDRVASYASNCIVRLSHFCLEGWGLTFSWVGFGVG